MKICRVRQWGSLVRACVDYRGVVRGLVRVHDSIEGYLGEFASIGGGGSSQ